MTEPAKKRRYTVEEYLRMERDALDKHEFHNGEILAMSGTSYRHSLIAANLIREVGNRLKGKPCKILESNLRVRIAASNRYVYPDATIICGPPEMDSRDSKLETITNPRVIFEVLSPGTEGYDRGDKFNSYQSIASLEEYVLISQSTPRVESYLRQSEGGWLLHSQDGPAGNLKLRTMKIEIPLAEIYAGVEFTPPTESNPNPT